MLLSTVSHLRGFVDNSLTVGRAAVLMAVPVDVCVDVCDPQVGELLGGAVIYSVTFRCVCVTIRHGCCLVGCWKWRQCFSAPLACIVTPTLHHYQHQPPPPPAAAAAAVLARLFKLPGQLEAPPQEDYGQTVTYNGSIPGATDTYHLDSQHTFAAGRWCPLPAHCLSSPLHIIGLSTLCDRAHMRVCVSLHLQGGWNCQPMHTS
jgi:hypothetical protein